ncbi:MAG: glycosyl transferase family 1, partial [Bacteroidetes bacterium HGW-Bacteroidetes-22]
MESAKKKIIIIGSAYPLRGGGISTFNERLAKAFQEQGDDVIIYTFSLQYPYFFFPGTTQYSKEAPPEKINIKIQINSINPINWIVSAIRISNEKPDLIVIRYWIPYMAPCLGTIARLIRSKAPVVAITDNIIPHEERTGDRLLTRYFIKSVDRFVAMSKTVLNDLALFDQKKIKSYYPHPLYDNFGNAVTKQEACQLLNIEFKQRYILFFGFIREYKGLDLLLKAMSNFNVRKMNVKLIIAGE